VFLLVPTPIPMGIQGDSRSPGSEAEDSREKQSMTSLLRNCAPLLGASKARRGSQWELFGLGWAWFGSEDEVVSRTYVGELGFPLILIFAWRMTPFPVFHMCVQDGKVVLLTRMSLLRK